MSSPNDSNNPENQEVDPSDENQQPQYRQREVQVASRRLSYDHVANFSSYNNPGNEAHPGVSNEQSNHPLLRRMLDAPSSSGSAPTIPNPSMDDNENQALDLSMSSSNNTSRTSDTSDRDNNMPYFHPERDHPLLKHALKQPIPRCSTDIAETIKRYFEQNRTHMDFHILDLTLPYAVRNTGRSRSLGEIAIPDYQRASTSAQPREGGRSRTVERCRQPVSPIRVPLRTRRAFSERELYHLEQEFRRDHRLTAERRREMAARLDISEDRIKYWFQNRRASHEKQLQDRFNNSI